MFNLKRKMVAVAMGCLLSVGVYAQKQDKDKRPPKQETKIVVQPKGERPPQSNNQGNRRGDRRGRP